MLGSSNRKSLIKRQKKLPSMRYMMNGTKEKEYSIL
jgi:hypothetical protein